MEPVSCPLVIEVANEMVSGSDFIGLVADHLGFVVAPFDRAVIDRLVEPRQDVFLMAANHPGKLANELPTKTIASGVSWQGFVL